MNQTVARIVDILFSNTAETEETVALHEELMNNCQEHYDDLVAHGLSENEAIGAVVESLNGMKELIDEYPKKGAEPVKEPEPVAEPEKGPADDAASQTGPDFETDGASIRVLSVNLPGEDVRIAPSEDGRIRISCSEAELLSFSVRGDTLNVSTAPRDPFRFMDKTADEFRKDTAAPFDWTLKSIMNFVSNTVSSVVNVITNAEPVYISLPVDHAFTLRISSRSGDVSVNGVRADDIDVHTASGDISVFLSRDCRAGSVTVASASGDIRINAAADRMSLNSISGEITFTGDTDALKMKTVSGDVDCSGGAEDLTATTISGDIRADLTDAGVRSVNASTTSGDITVTVAVMPGGIHAETSSRSGECYCRFPDAGDGAALRVRASSISGSIRIS